MTQAEYKYGFSPSCGFEIAWEAFLFLEDRGDSTGFVRAEGAARPWKEKTQGKLFLTAHCYKANPFSMFCPHSTEKYIKKAQSVSLQ